ncbi:hypothetical protein ACTOB_000162 [Actinoplanes oblitus]|uniref:LamG-like jellyroll fold domain-containing protein n=1 Tax=Actinoplanes oblitus TaxID=3040509 RepID=A0ABY8WII8_9ACTN|nr:LamG-like jellyroll fold domain-containing protein [Actinoplanes oblitus]WIM96702.1 hypothetical protein ACTOB_000162 [Actinoplanes oblitus]
MRDAGETSNAWIASRTTAVFGAWVHLAGVYDAEDNTIELYVNGVSQGTQTALPGWAADRNLNIGQATWHSGRVRRIPLEREHVELRHVRRQPPPDRRRPPPLTVERQP